MRSTGPFTHHAPVSESVQRDPGPFDECLVGNNDEPTACVCMGAWGEERGGGGWGGNDIIIT